MLTTESQAQHNNQINETEKMTDNSKNISRSNYQESKIKLSRIKI